MVAIKDFGMPSCCANCPFDALNKCLLTRQFIKGGRLVNGEDKRLDDCPLVEIEERKVGKWIPIWDSEAHLAVIAYQCSECWIMTNTKSDYCAGCGAEMKGIEE